MTDDDRDYFEQRAEAELELALRAEHRQAVRAHYELACAYLDKVYPADEEEEEGS